MENPYQKDKLEQTNTSRLSRCDKKILMIEDDELLVRMYKTKLLMGKFDVDTVFDGEEALKKLKSGKYDLVLLDLMLPKIDGFTILSKLRNSKWSSRNKPVIIFSNLGQDNDISRAKEMGANDYLIKASLTPNQVVEKIKKYLD